MALQNNYFVERAECPGCLGGESHTLYECEFCTNPIRQYLRDFYGSQGGIEYEFLEGARFVLEQCRTCGLVFQRQIGNDLLLKKLYDEWIDPTLAKERDGQQRGIGIHIGYAEEIITMLSECEKLPSEVKVLDFGMGWGRWARMVNAFGCQAFGLELSEERTRYAQSQGITIVAWEDIPGAQFDFINTEQVFEHLAHPLVTLRHLAEGLAPAGLLKISVPNGARIPRLLRNPDWKATSQKQGRRSLNAVAPLEHINCFNQNALFQMSKSAGLEPAKLGPKTDIRVKNRRGRSWFCNVGSHLGRAERAIKRAAKQLYFGETSHLFRKARH